MYDGANVIKIINKIQSTKHTQTYTMFVARNSFSCSIRNAVRLCAANSLILVKMNVDSEMCVCEIIRNVQCVDCVSKHKGRKKIDETIFSKEICMVLFVIFNFNKIATISLSVFNITSIWVSYTMSCTVWFCVQVYVCYTCAHLCAPFSVNLNLCIIK